MIVPPWSRPCGTDVETVNAEADEESVLMAAEKENASVETAATVPPLDHAMLAHVEQATVKVVVESIEIMPVDHTPLKLPAFDDEPVIETISAGEKMIDPPAVATLENTAVAMLIVVGVTVVAVQNLLFTPADVEPEIENVWPATTP